MADFTLDPKRTALIIQDMQNDVIIEGGAFAESGSPGHAKEQNVVANSQKLADACRAKGVPVIHVHYIVEEGAPGLKLNAPLFQGLKEAGAMVRGSWGAAPAEGLEPKQGDYVVEKMRMSAWEQHGRSRGLLLDNERRVAQRVDQLRAPERLDGDQLGRGHRGARVVGGRGVAVFTFMGRRWRRPASPAGSIRRPGT